MSVSKPRAGDKYRPDIDGLRAVAVLLVLVYHAGFPVSGGFVGVDVFFVISGYLITGIIWREILEERFSFKSFYLRRIKRLLPALLAVVVFSSIVAALVFMPADFLAYSKGLPYVLTGLANFHFLEVTQSYFAQDAELLPLIHTWSLAVEEQYYVVWPLLLIAVYRFRARINARVLSGLALATFLSFLLLSEYWARVSPSQAYYLLHARAFELMMGGFLAVYEPRFPRLPQWLTSIISVLGMVLIVASAMLLSRDSVFPGFSAFWVCLGTVLVIYAGGVSNKALSNRVLAWQPLVFIGLLSYSIYLWHWPLVAAANYLNLALGGVVGWCIVLISLLLSWLSWLFVEQKVRAQQGLHFGKAFTLFLLLPVLAALVFHQVVRKTDGWPQRLPEPLQSVALDYLNDRPAELFPSCHDRQAEIDTSRRCYIGDTEKSKNGNAPDFLLLGDSHANAASGIFDVLGKAEGQYGLMISAGSSPFLIDADRYKLNAAGDREPREHYRPRMDNIKTWLAENYHGRVFLAAIWQTYIARDSVVFDPDFEAALRETVNFLLENGNEVTLFLAVPGIPDNPDARCVALDRIESHPLFSGELVPRGTSCQALQDSYPRELFAEKQAQVTAFLASMFRETDGVTLMDPMDSLCDASSCRVVLEGRYIYLDLGHLNFSGGQALGRAMLASDNNVLSREDSPESSEPR